MSIYDFTANSIEGDTVSLSEFKDKVLIIVNTASKCGFTPQYEGLEQLYKKYRSRGFEILAFPSNQFGEQEPGENLEVKNFCMINYGVSFPLFEKTEVRGENAHPLFTYLTENAPFKGFDPDHPAGKKLSSFIHERFPQTMEGDSIKWNFTKFLINRKGDIVGRYEPPVSPLDMEEDIEKLL